MGCAKSIRTEPRNHPVQGAWRIRTAVRRSPQLRGRAPHQGDGAIRTLVITLAFTTLALLVVGFTGRPTSAAGRDWQSAYRYWHGAAVRQRHRADDLQRRLTVRVLENRALRTKTAALSRLRRQVLRRPDVLEAIRLAATAYHVDYDTLLRRARCESVLNPNAQNRSSSAAGLFQFLDSTWASTPYGRESVWSPYSNALAAAWMEANGRGGEWVCR